MPLAVLEVEPLEAQELLEEAQVLEGVLQVQ